MRRDYVFVTATSTLAERTVVLKMRVGTSNIFSQLKTVNSPMVRHVHGTTFYHKGPLPEIPAAVHKLTVRRREEGTGCGLMISKGCST
jgi:hypothetical protein